MYVHVYRPAFACLLFYACTCIYSSIENEWEEKREREKRGDTHYVLLVTTMFVGRTPTHMPIID